MGWQVGGAMVGCVHVQASRSGDPGGMSQIWGTVKHIIMVKAIGLFKLSISMSCLFHANHEI